MLRVIQIFIFLFILLISSKVSSEESELIFEHCFLSKSKGIKTGYVCVSQIKAIYNGKSAIITKKHMDQKFKRLNDTVQINQVETFIEDTSGNPLEFSLDSDNKGEKIQLTGKFDEFGKILIESEINGIKGSKSVQSKGKVLFPWGIDELYRKSPSSIIQYQTIDPGLDIKFIEIKAEKVGKEILTEGNLNGQYTKYKLQISLLPNIEAYEWRDKNFRTVKEYASILDIEQILVNKTEILDIPAQFDIFSESFIKVPNTIKDADLIDKAVYKIYLKNMSVKDLFINDSVQKIIKTEDDTVLLSVKTERNDDYKYPYPLDVKDYEEYIKSGPYIITDTEKIIKLTESLSKGETDSYKLAKKLDRWVYKNITNKNLTVDFGNAIEVLESKGGDCTEHSVLLASLLRTANIPSKVVVGLVYTNTPQNGFVYHMWVKAYVGKWINLDPSFPYSNFTPLHIAMGESSLNELSDKNALVMNVIKGFSNINIEIMDISKPAVIPTKDKPIIYITTPDENTITDYNILKISASKQQLTPSNIQQITVGDKVEKDPIRQAYYNYSIGKFDDALSELETYHGNIEEGDDFSRMKLALKSLNMGFFDFASKVIKEIEDKEIWGNYINYLIKMNFPTLKMPSDVEMVAVNALNYLNFKDDTESVLDITMTLQDFDYINYLRAKAFRKNKNLKEAQNSILKAIKTAPASLGYRMELANIFSDQNDIVKAQEQLKYINLIAKKNVVKDQEFWKQYKMIDFWLKAKQNEKNNYLLGKYYEAFYYLTKGEFNQAEEVTVYALNYKKTAYLYELLGDIYYAVDRFKGAKFWYEKALNLDPKRIRANIGLGNVYFSEEENLKSNKYYNDALKLSPYNIEALLALGKLNAYLGYKKKSYEYYKRVLTINKNNPEVLYILGIELAYSGNYKEGKRLLKKSLSANPMASLIWADLARIEINEKNYPKAFLYLTTLKNINENNPYYYYLSALILKETDKMAEAEKYLKKALELKPDLINEIIPKKEELKEFH